MKKGKLLIQNLKDILHKNKIKKTESRLLILDIFFRFNKPISADFIYRKLFGKINETTIYRNLSLFEKNQILRRVNLRKDSIYFELNNNHHHHIVCTQCEIVEDFKENREVANLFERVIRKSIKFKNIKEHSIELFGICKKCN